jgi:hypothetical protein
MIPIRRKTLYPCFPAEKICRGRKNRQRLLDPTFMWESEQRRVAKL